MPAVPPASPLASLLARLFAGVLSTALSVLCATACGAGGQAPRDRRTLVAAIDNDPGHLNPAITTNDSVHTASALFYNGLLTLDDDLTSRPELAERWDVGRRPPLRFHLRRGVRWYDGRPFTAADVAFTFDSLLLRFHARTRASIAPALLRVEAIDDSTIGRR